jgi:hypothetical protein
MNVIPSRCGASTNPDVYRNFFTGKSIRELVEAQGLKPVEDIPVFAGGLSDEEHLVEMIEEIYLARLAVPSR